MTAARADDPGRIHRVATQLVAAVNAGDIDGILSCWDPAGVLLPPHHPAVHGHAAIGAYFARVFAARRFTFAFGDATLTVDADLAVERLAYMVDVLPVGGGPAFSDAGKGLHVYARQPDGTWRIVQDIWNSDRPLAPLPQPASRNAS